MTTNVVEKWGEIVAARGFAQIPNHLLLANQLLGPDEGFSPIELLVLIQLAAAWWRKDELPFPSVSTLASRTGASTRQVQRALSALEERNLLRRVRRRTRGVIASNAYDLAPLADFLEQLGKAFPNRFPRRLTGAAGSSEPVESVTLEDEASPRQIRPPPKRKLKLELEGVRSTLSPEKRSQILRTVRKAAAAKKSES